MLKDRPVTLEEVARHAGVSLGTASNVLHGKRALHSNRTANKVLESANLLGYRSNHLARSLASKRTQIIGFVTERHQTMLTRNRYVIHVLDGILDYLVPLDYHIKLISLLNDEPQHVWSQIDNGTLDGAIVVAPVIGSPLLQWRERSSLPVVVVGSALPSEIPLSWVDVDNESAMFQLVDWLIAQGHRNIGFVQGPPQQWSALQRENGYRRALSHYQIALQPHWIAPGDYDTGSGVEAGKQLLAQNPDLTAIVAANDQMAAGVLEACRALGKRVPEDISVTGFDDMDLARHTTPPLTTIRHTIHDNAMKATKRLVAQIQSDEKPALVQELVPGELVIRDSVSQARQAVPVSR